MALYKQTDVGVWAGRTDGFEPDVLRWHQVMRLVNLEENSLPVIGAHYQGIALLGFCSHEGVRRNMGRPGAIDGPRYIRQACCNLPLQQSHIVLLDAGDIICNDQNLEAAQQLLGQKVHQLKEAHYLPIVLGGGHEVSYGSFSHLEYGTKPSSVGVVNFDAHFDLRQPGAEGATSGTGFYQMHQWCAQQKIKFHYLALGIQSASNTRRLFNVADDIGANYIIAEHMHASYEAKVVQAINTIVQQAAIIHLSVDMDVFAAAWAPGVSAPALNGLMPDYFFLRVLRHLVLSGKVGVIDIAELNPEFDIDSRTARLAASLIFEMVNAADLNMEY